MLTAPLTDPERRVKSTSSGLGPSSSEATIGSSAMPQIGQAPGPSAHDLGMHRAGVLRAGWAGAAARVAAA